VVLRRRGGIVTPRQQTPPLIADCSRDAADQPGDAASRSHLDAARPASCAACGWLSLSLERGAAQLGPPCRRHQLSTRLIRRAGRMRICSPKQRCTRSRAAAKGTVLTTAHPQLPKQLNCDLPALLRSTTTPRRESSPSRPPTLASEASLPPSSPATSAALPKPSAHLGSPVISSI
jgi:hypothetical protein